MPKKMMRCPLEDDYGSNAVEGLKKKLKKKPMSITRGCSAWSRNK